MFLLHSCGGDESVGPDGQPTDAPLMTVSASSKQVAFGDTVTFVISGNRSLNDQPLKSLTITENDQSLSASRYRISDLDWNSNTKTNVTTFGGGDTWQVGAQVNVGTLGYNPGNYTYQFVLEDEAGKKSVKEVVITTTGTFTPLEFEKTGAVLGNKLSNGTAAFNLATNQAENSNNSDGSYIVSDMQNQSNTVGEDWINGWIAENTTTFLESNGFDYDNASMESAKSTFEAKPLHQFSEIRGVKTGNIYIAKLAGTEEFVVIKITHVDANTAGDNEKIEFSYKKRTETAGQ